MALILTMKEGQSFYVDDDRIEVKKIVDDLRFVVGMCDGREIDVIDSKSVEVLPDVFLSAGNKAMLGTVRVVISAPADRLILKDSLYEQDKKDERRIPNV